MPPAVLTPTTSSTHYSLILPHVYLLTDLMPQPNKLHPSKVQNNSPNQMDNPLLQLTSLNLHSPNSPFKPEFHIHYLSSSTIYLQHTNKLMLVVVSQSTNMGVKLNTMAKLCCKCGGVLQIKYGEFTWQMTTTTTLFHPCIIEIGCITQHTPSPCQIHNIYECINHGKLICF